MRNPQYPHDWEILSLQAREKAGWQCQACRKRCLTPIDWIWRKRQPRYRWAGDLLQVHHIDGDRGNNIPENWICLCSVCHLAVHRQAGRKPKLVGCGRG